MVHYPPGYPDEVPEISLRYDDTSVNEDDEKKLTEELLKIVSWSAHFTHSPDVDKSLGHREYRNGNDIHSRLPSTRANRSIDSGENSIAEQDRGRKGAVGTGSKRKLASHN